MNPFNKSAKPVRVIEHTIRGGWTLCLAEHEATDEHCFCWWPADAKREAIALANEHYETVEIAPDRPQNPPISLGRSLLNLVRNHLKP